ncbi:MAG: ABC transporter permease, partial [Actinomycetia bacterium]|nr:ABC transporter permease [Actinomycetes bacterium]
MKAYLAFCKKELLESWRTWRAIIMLAAFVVFGILSPATAKLLPVLLDGADMGGGVIIHLPTPTALDSWTQFFKNVGQMGMLVVVIVFCGIVANELSRGTLINMLTKGMRRSTVILAKFSVAADIWTVSYLVCLGVAYAYTAYYWPGKALPHMALAFAAPWVFGLLLIALLILGGVLFKNLYGSLLVTGGVVVAMNLLNLIPQFSKYNPVSLASGTLGLLSKQN